MKICVSTIVLTCSLSIGYAGSITSYADLGSFNAAVGATSTDTFDGMGCIFLPGALSASTSSSCSSSGSIAPGQIQPNVTYSVPNAAYSTSFAIDGGGSFTSNFLDANIGVGNLAPGSAPLTVTFATPVSAVAWDELNGDGQSFNVSIIINFVGGGSATESGTVGPAGVSVADTFFGFQSSLADISSIVIDTNSGHAEFEVDNFAIPTSALATPEPSQFLPLLGVFAVFPFLKRKVVR